MDNTSGIVFQHACHMEPSLRAIPRNTRDIISAMSRNTMDELLPPCGTYWMNAQQLKEPAPRFGVPHGGVAAQAVEQGGACETGRTAEPSGNALAVTTRCVTIRRPATPQPGR